ncbi:hypothetical protein [Halobaculum sp. P14]
MTEVDGVCRGCGETENLRLVAGVPACPSCERLLNGGEHAE